jgi:predicted DNA-binding ribbon-helix-helix protein
MQVCLAAVCRPDCGRRINSHKGDDVKSPVIKRSILLAGHKTSVSLEEAFWQGLKEIATHRGVSVSALISVIDTRRSEGNLSSGIRLFVLDYFRTLASQQLVEGRSAHGEGALGGENLRSASTVMPPALRRSA